MNIVIRADASTSIGTGHIMRCLTLAGRLREKGCTITFVCRDWPGNINHLIAASGYRLYALPAFSKGWRGFDWERDAAETVSVIEQSGTAVAWLIVDHYRLDWHWQQKLRQHVGEIMVIDDLADRKHNCDILLDQNVFLNTKDPYQGYVPAHCRRLLGPRYALLRQEFREIRKQIRKRDGKISRINISFGGTDPTNETVKILKTIKAWNRPDIQFDVIVGETNPYKDEIQRLCAITNNTTYYCQVNNMAELMSQADLAIGAGGVTTWERCCLGLPSIIITVAGNQEDIARRCHDYGAGIYAGPTNVVPQTVLVEILERMIKYPEIGYRLSQRAMELVDGFGVDRVTASLWERNGISSESFVARTKPAEP